MKGLTLIELLVSLFVLSIIGIVGFNIQKSLFTFSDLLEGALSSQQETRQTFNVISRELRSASPSVSGAYPLAQASSTSLAFFSDINNDELTEKIRYFLDNGTVKKGIVYPTGTPLSYPTASEKISIMVNNVYNTSSLFVFYDNNYDGTTSSQPLAEPPNIPAISSIKLNIVVISENSQKEKLPQTMTTQITIRNIKDNL